MTPLENPPENPCFGCGPEHARGLHLNFARDGDDIVCTYTPKPDEIGWPGIFHTGLHFTVLFETCYWAALELTGQVHVASGPQVYEHKRLPRVGAPFTVRARILSREPFDSAPQGAVDKPWPAGHGFVKILAESATLEGKPLGRAECGMAIASRAGTERAGIALPSYLTDQMAP